MITSLLALVLTVQGDSCNPNKLTTEYAGNGFGGSGLAIQDGTAVVGAPFQSFGGQQRGAAFVFERDQTGWHQAQMLYAPDDHNGSWFGSSTSIDGSTLAIAAPRLYNTQSSSNGALYIFKKSSNGWFFDAKITDPNAQPFDTFAERISLSGDLLAASSVQLGGIRRVTLFRKQGSNWNLEFRRDLLATGTPLLSVSGDTLLVRGGATTDDVSTFHYSNGQWSFEQQLSNQTSVTDISISGDRAAIGEPAFERARIFERTGSTWSEIATLTNPNQPTSSFGLAVKLSNEYCLVTAPIDASSGVVGGGAGLLFRTESGSYSLIDIFYPIEDRQLIYLGNPNAALWNTSAILSTDPSFSGEAAYCFLGDSPVSAYGFCGSSAPCLNLSYTAGCRNSTGLGSRLEPCGTTSERTDDLLLTAPNLPLNKPGLFFMGGAALSNSPLGDGQMCVASGGKGVYRYPVHTSGSIGELREGPGIVALSHTRFGANGHIVAGDTWYFQCWYRDPLGPCGSGFNLTNAVAVTFAP